MWSIFEEEITYVNISELKDSTSNSELKWSNDEEIKKYVRKAERIIDNLIEKHGTKKQASQRTIFPTVSDLIPIEIKQATILLSERVFEKRNETEKERTIKSETRRWNSVTYADKKNKYKEMHSCMTEEIYVLIEKYISSNTSPVVGGFYRT
jgi:hypothetical protein